jgi:hypothetical protein
MCGSGKNHQIPLPEQIFQQESCAAANFYFAIANADPTRKGLLGGRYLFCLGLALQGEDVLLLVSRDLVLH